MPYIGKDDKTFMQLTAEEWNNLKYTDISDERKSGFLMYGQIFRGRILLDGKKWNVGGWKATNGNMFVILTLVEENKT